MLGSNEQKSLNGRELKNNSSVALFSQIISDGLPTFSSISNNGLSTTSKSIFVYSTISFAIPCLNGLLNSSLNFSLVFIIFILLYQSSLQSSLIIFRVLLCSLRLICLACKRKLLPSYRPDITFALSLYLKTSQNT